MGLVYNHCTISTGFVFPTRSQDWPSANSGQSGPELLMFLPQSPLSWDYRLAPLAQLKLLVYGRRTKPQHLYVENRYHSCLCLCIEGGLCRHPYTSPDKQRSSSALEPCTGWTSLIENVLELATFACWPAILICHHAAAWTVRRALRQSHVDGFCLYPSFND